MNAYDLLKKANKAYYNGNEIMSDHEFDKLKREVEESSDNVVIGTEIVGKRKMSHMTLMPSMRDVFNLSDAIKWMKSIKDSYPKVTFIVEYKYDGMAVNNIFKDGYLEHSITRGNGLVGGIITDHITTNNIVQDNIGLKGRVELRGELVISQDNFDNANVNNEYSNPRSLVAGTINSDDVTLAGIRGVEFYPYTIVGFNYVTEVDKWKLIKDLGMNMLPIINNVIEDDLESIYNKAIASRESLSVPIDGLVLRINETYIQEEIRTSGKYPRWLLALKLPPIVKSCIILDVEAQLGRTGVITPVAKITDTVIDGTIVNSPTLNNYKDIELKDIRIGDKCSIIKSGDIIPKITFVYKDSRSGEEKEIVPPTNCPVCNSTLVFKGRILKCINTKCKGRVLSTLQFMVSRDRLNIDGLGDTMLEKLYNNSSIYVPSDIFSLTVDDLMEVNLSKEYALKILTEIDKRKHTSIPLAIASLGIPLIGVRICTKLYKELGKDFWRSSKEDIIRVDGIGDSVSDALTSYIKDNIVDVEDFLNSLVLEDVVAVVKDGVLNGEVFSITGTFDNVARSDIIKIIEDNGGVFSKNITSNVSQLIYGDKAGSKLKLALSKGIEVKTLKELISLLK